MGFRAKIAVWVTQHQRECLWGLALLGLALRVLLVRGAPQPFGYVYDFYHHPVELFDRTGRLPESTADWQAYHPPLFYLMGLVFYRAGRLFSDTLALPALSLLAMACSMATIYYGVRMLRLFRVRGAQLVLGAALLWGCPCLFISSYGAEADILLTAVMTAFTYHLLRYHQRPRRARARDALRLGLLAGLAISTKYNGLIALALAGEVFAVRLLLGPLRRLALRDGALLLAVCLAVGGWKYVDNYRKYGNPMFANVTTALGLSVAHRQSNWGHYPLFAFHLGEAVALLKPDAPPGKLTDFPVYSEIWTSLHAQAWSDMSIFSNPTRHGVNEALYPWRGVPAGLAGTVLRLGVLADLLALLGLCLTIFRRPFWPLALLLATTMLVYLYWVSAQLVWAVKFKYILFLWPVYVVYMVVGWRWTARRLPWPLRDAVSLALLALVAAAHLYLFRFAIGQ